MSDGEWTGGIANRAWIRPGNRNLNVQGDRDRGPRLAALMANEEFWCDTCEARHALIEHRACRAAATAAILAGR